MNEYPELMIEAGSHTDSRGEDKYNMRLSEKRAKSTVDYIVSKGIDPSRITYQGYGENRSNTRMHAILLRNSEKIKFLHFVQNGLK